MYSFISNLKNYFTSRPKEKIIHTKQSREREIAASLLGNSIDPHKLYDCVMVDDRYQQVQNAIRLEKDPRFDPLYDLGVILGSSTSIDDHGLPEYYVVGWFNVTQPEKPILRNYAHFSLTPILRPLSDLGDRSKKLNTLFESFLLNWLDLINNDNSTEH